MRPFLGRIVLAQLELQAKCMQDLHQVWPAVTLKAKSLSNAVS